MVNQPLQGASRGCLQGRTMPSLAQHRPTPHKSPKSPQNAQYRGCTSPQHPPEHQSSGCTSPLHPPKSPIQRLHEPQKPNTEAARAQNRQYRGCTSPKTAIQRLHEPKNGNPEAALRCHSVRVHCVITRCECTTLSLGASAQRCEYRLAIE